MEQKKAYLTPKTLIVKSVVTELICESISFGSKEDNGGGTAEAKERYDDEANTWGNLW